MQLAYHYPWIALLALSACTVEKNTTDSASETGTSVTASSGTTAEPTTAEPTTAEPTTAGPTTASPSEPATSDPSTTGGTTTQTTSGTTEHIPDTGVVDPISVVIETACAPDDGPALLFKYGVSGDDCTADFPEDAPIVNITLFQSAPLEPGAHTLDGGNGFATYDNGNGVLMTTTGTIFISDWNGGAPFGQIDLDFGDNGGIESDFFAIFCDTSPPCG